MSVRETAQKFADACKAGRFEDAEAMWAEDVASFEDMEGPMRDLRGRQAVHDKGVWWFENHKIHKSETEGPFVHGDQFSLIFRMDITRKSDGERIKMEEVGLYTVKNGKIAEERFFHA